jgi:hypothetical protein
MAAEVGESLRAALLAMSAVTDLVGTGDDARIRPRLEQEEDVPANGSITIEEDFEDHLNDLLGQGGREMIEVNIVCRAPTKKASKALAEAVRTNGTNPGTGLAGYNGTPIDVEIDCWLDGVTPSFTHKGDGSDDGWWDTNCSYMVTQAETV